MSISANLAQDTDRSIAELLNLALSHHQVGRLDDAQALYEEVLRREADNPSALNLLGVVWHATGRDAEAEPMIRRAVEITGGNPDFTVNLASVLCARDGAEEAERLLRGVLSERPSHRQALNLMTRLLSAAGRNDEAVAVYRQAVQYYPTWTAYRLGLINTLMTLERYPEAVESLRELSRMHGPEVSILCNLGVCCERADLEDEAEVAYRQCLALPVTERRPLENLVALLVKQERGDEAAALVRQTIETRPDHDQVVLHLMLGRSLYVAGDVDGAITAHEEGLRRDPGHLDTMVSLIGVLTQAKRFDKANLWARRLLLSSAENRKYYPVACMLFQCTCDFDMLDELGDPLTLMEEAPQSMVQVGFLGNVALARDDTEVKRLMAIHRRWAEGVEAPINGNPLPAILREKPRDKLRLGLLSSDLRSHSVGFFVMPLVDCYDRDRFEVHCFSPYPSRVDEVEEVVRAQVDSFERVAGLSDRAIAGKIREAGVDVLVELNGFTQHSRISALPYRCAPVQVEWLGYPFTIGFEALDYFLVDRHLRPERDDLLYEKVLEMPNAWICFTDVTTQEIAPTPPVDDNGHITFGTLNNMYKFTREMVALWAEIMAQVPDSQFLVVRPESDSLIFQHNLRQAFAAHGIAEDRIKIANNRREGRRFDLYYNFIDISLDTYPLTGGTTTVDALDMGVPVISLVGPAMHQRISHAILNHAGLPELVAGTPAEYVAKAVALANDRDRLRAYRTGLRPQVRTSTLCDSAGFARDFQETILKAATAEGLV